MLTRMDGGEEHRGLQPMPDWSFLMMVRSYRIVSFFQNPLRLLDRLSIKPGMTVVDYACGPARFSSEIGRRVGPTGRVFAVDIHPRAVAMVRDAARRDGLDNVTAVLAAGYDSHLPDGIADMVLLIDALHEIDDRAALVRELRRIIRCDGRLFIRADHMAVEEAVAAVTADQLFCLVARRCRELHFAPVQHQG